MAEDQEQTRLLQQMLEALQRSSGDTNAKEVKAAKKNLADYNLAVTRGTRAEEDKTNVMGKSAAMLNKATVGTSKFVAATAAAAGAVRENREDFNSLNPAIQLVGNGMQMASKTVGALGDAAGDALKGIPLLGPVIGGAVSAASKLTAALGQAAGEIVKTFGPMLTAELQRASVAYRNAGSVAALGADGLTGLANQAIDAGLSFTSFSNVVKQNAETMAFATRNSADSAKVLADTSKAMQPFRRGMLALGISVEQQNELTAGYIGLQQRLGRDESRDSQALAQGSRNYIQNLTELSKLTGKSVSEQQKELDAQSRHVRQAATQREVERRLGGQAGKDASAAISGVASVLKSAAPTLAGGFQDALGGNFKSEAAKNFYRATGEAGKDIINQLKAGTITREKALAGIQEAGAKRYDALGGDKFAMVAGNTGTAVEAILVDLQSLKFGAKFGDQIGKIETATQKTMKTTDATTNSMINAQESMIRSAQALDKLALQTSLPLAATAIDSFTKYSLKASKKMLAYADAFAKGGVDAVAEKLKEDTINKSVGDAGSALDKQDATNFNAGGLLMKADITVAKGVEGLVGFFSEGAKDFLKEMRVKNQTNYLENQGIKVKRDDYAATLAGPKSNMQKSDINQSSVIDATTARKQIDNEYNKLQTTPIAGNDNSNVVSEQQMTNKLLKRLVQQNQ
jgi:hypothetical protein